MTPRLVPAPAATSKIRAYSSSLADAERAVLQPLVQRSAAPQGGRPQIPPWRGEHIDDLPELIDRTVHIAPATSHLHIGLICLPAIPDRVPAGPGRWGCPGLTDRADGSVGLLEQ
jgi:hypothetical protein